MNSRRLIKAILLTVMGLFSIISTTKVLAGPQLIFTDLPEGVYLGRSLKLYKFPKKVDLNHVLSQKDNFIASEQAIPRFGYVYDDIWARLDLNNDSNAAKKVYFELKSPFEHVEGFLVVNDQMLEKSVAGMFMPLSEETAGVGHAYPVLVFNIPPGKSTVYFSEDAIAPSYPVIAHSEKSMMASKELASKAVFAFIGSCLIIFIFVLSLFFMADRKLSALLLIAFIGFFIVSGFVTGMFRVICGVVDITNLYLPIYPYWIPQVSIYSLSLGLFAILFSGPEHFIATKKRKFMTAIGLIGPILLALFSLIDPIFAMNTFGICSFFILGLAIYSCAKRYRANNPEEIFQLIGWLIFGFCSTSQLGYFIGVINNTFFAFWGNQIGFPIIIALMGLSILDRNRRTLIHLLENLETKVKERTKELSEKNRDIRSILENMNIGMFSITEGGLVHPQYSTHLEKIYERSDIARTKGVDLIFKSSNLSADTRDQVSAAIDSIVGGNSIAFDMNSHLLIREIAITIREKNKKLLSIDWIPIEADDTIDKLLVSIKDITADRQMEAEAERYRLEMRVINEIVQLGFANYLNAMESFVSLLSEIDTILRGDDDKNNIDIFYRKLHTIKGNSRVFGLTGIAGSAHACEDHLQGVRNKAHAFDKVIFSEKLDQLKNTIATYRNIWQAKLGKLHLNSGNTDAEFGAKIGELITRFKTSGGEFKLTLDEIISEFSRVHTKTLADILEVTSSRIKKECVILGKEEPQIEFKGAPAYFHRKAHNTLQNVFTHCLGNSIDHGLEDADERLKKGKETFGTISFETQFADKFLRIIYQDDGRGINTKKLIEKFGKQGMNEQQAAELIFKSGVSTKDETSDLSGRGVGMDAVKSELNEIGGSIKLELLSGKKQDGYCLFRFIISIPEKLVSSSCHIF